MMSRINFRIPDELLAAAERMAKEAKMSLGEWTRSLIEKATGVKVEVKLGMAGADETTKQRVEKARIRGIKKRAKGVGF